MRKTWELVGETETLTLKEMENLFSYHGNSRNYRAKLAKEKLPCVPFVGMWLTDLTFIFDGVPDMLEVRIFFVVVVVGNCLFCCVFPYLLSLSSFFKPPKNREI